MSLASCSTQLRYKRIKCCHGGIREGTPPLHHLHQPPTLLAVPSPGRGSAGGLAACVIRGSGCLRGSQTAAHLGPYSPETRHEDPPSPHFNCLTAMVLYTTVHPCNVFLWHQICLMGMVLIILIVLLKKRQMYSFLYKLAHNEKVEVVHKLVE